MDPDRKKEQELIAVYDVVRGQRRLLELGYSYDEISDLLHAELRYLVDYGMVAPIPEEAE